MTNNAIDRRAALRKTALLMGGAVSTPTIIGIMQGCAPSVEVNWQPILLSEEQARTVTAMVDVILPAGEIPGAVGVGIPQFVDSMVGVVYDPEAKKIFMDGLNEVMQEIESERGDAFEDLDPDTQFQIVDDLNRTYVGAINVPADPGEERRDDDDKSFFRYLKELTIVGYCRSEVGATQLLQYDKVPGDYKGCIPIEEVGRAWAT